MDGVDTIADGIHPIPSGIAFDFQWDSSDPESHACDFEWHALDFQWHASHPWMHSCHSDGVDPISTNTRFIDP